MHRLSFGEGWAWSVLNAALLLLTEWSGKVKTWQGRIVGIESGCPMCHVAAGLKADGKVGRYDHSGLRVSRHFETPTPLSKQSSRLS